MPYTFGVNNGGRDNSELIPIHNNDGDFCVSSIDLHKFLGIGRGHASWMKPYLSLFVEGRDLLEKNPKVLSKTNGRPRSSFYLLTIDCAKQIAMMSRTEKGREAREYFLKVEKRFKQIVSSSELNLSNVSTIITQSVTQAVTIALTQALSTTIVPVINQQSELISRLMDRMDRLETVKEKQQKHIQTLTDRPLRDMCNVLVGGEVKRLFKEPIDEDYRNVRGMLYQEFKRINYFEFPTNCKNKMAFLEENGLMANFYQFLLDRRDGKLRLL